MYLLSASPLSGTDPSFYTAAEQALLDAPLPSPHLPNRLAACFRIRPRPQDLPFGERLIPDPLEFAA